MGTVKFRVWDKSRKGWITSADGVDVFMTPNGDVYVGELNNPPLVKIDPEYVSLNTGFKDKNSVEIHEGDIIKHKDPSDVFRHYTKEPMFKLNVVKRDEGTAGFKVINGPMVLIGSSEVIGNVYNNPELLNQIKV